MGKQKKILTEILKSFDCLDNPKFQSRNDQIFHQLMINHLFRKSKNKSDLVRRILNEIVLDDENKINLLRICFLKESEL